MVCNHSGQTDKVLVTCKFKNPLYYDVHQISKYEKLFNTNYHQTLIMSQKRELSEHEETLCRILPSEARLAFLTGKLPGLCRSFLDKLHEVANQEIKQIKIPVSIKTPEDVTKYAVNKKFGGFTKQFQNILWSILDGI